MTECFICNRIQQIKDNQNPFFVKELKSGYVVLCDFQLFEGYTIFLSKEHKSELHELAPENKALFLNEMALVAEAVFRAFQPQKLNYELLGNTDTHLHWHLIPRYGTDPQPKMPIWVLGKTILADEKVKPDPGKLSHLKQKLLHYL